MSYETALQSVATLVINVLAGVDVARGETPAAS
jgi:hypothetical protein